ncbi:MAG: hypothetical protein ACFB16_26980 [Phormidesmis sp.]
MPQSSEPTGLSVESNTALARYAAQHNCWIILCYLGPQGITLHAICVSVADSNNIFCDIQGWFSTSGTPLSSYEIETHRQLVWVIRGEPFTSSDDKEEQLQSLRLFALDVMRPDIEAMRATKPHNPFS